MALRPKAALVLGATFALAAAVPRLSAAQHITIDGRFSPAQTLVGPNYSITAGLGKQVGGNLFHSFGQLGLTTGESAAFSGPATVNNVIGRVTGGTTSSIDGKIQSNIAGANLYLINPSGVVFGPHATVNVSGSFHASTADYLKMSDGAKFQATNPDGSTLSAAPPGAFGFLTARPAALSVNGSTLGPVQGTLGLVGGPVSITGATLATPAGTIHVASAASAGEVPVDPRNTGTSTVSSFGPVDIRGGSKLDVSNPSGLGTGGSVFIRSGALTIDASEINADNYGSGAGGQLVLRGDSQVALSNRANAHAVAYGTGSGAGVTISTAPSGVISADASTVLTDTSGSGAGGALSLEAGRLTVTNGANVLAQSSGAGTGGAVDVKIGGPLTVDSGASLGTVAYAAGNAGNVSASIAGPITIDMSVGALPSILQGIGSLTYGVGNAGNVTIAGGALSLVNNGEIASNTLGPGDAGKVTVTASGQLIIDGLRASSAALPTGIFSEALRGSGGSAGNLSVAAGTLTLRNGGEIAASTFGTESGGSVTVKVAGGLSISGTPGQFNTGIFANSNSAAENSGDAGTVTVSAGDLVIAGNGAQISSNTSGSGRAGNVIVNAGSLSIASHGTISSNTFGSGDAGSVIVTADTLSLSGDAAISSLAFGKGNAGNVSVGISGQLSIDGTSSTPLAGITSDSERSSKGNAGVVTVSAGTLTIVNTGQISSNTFGTGSGGSVFVMVAGRLSISGASELFTGIFANSNSAAENSGDAGTVFVSAGDLAIAGAGSRISSDTAGSGKAGSVTVNAGSLSLLDSGAISSSTIGAGHGGNVFVTAGSLRIAGSGDISTVSSGSGPAGSVSVNVTGGQLGALTILTNGSVRASTFGDGDAGSVAVRVVGGLTIDGTGANPGDITGISSQANLGSRGKAGDITGSAGNLSIVNNGVISSNTFASGAGGNVTISVAGDLVINGVANPSADTGIFARTADLNGGNAGRINVAADNISILNRGLISTSTFGRGFAGEIAVNVVGALEIDGAGTPGFVTGIASSANLGTGNAGQVTISTGSLSISHGGQIQSVTYTSGVGGTVQVMALGPSTLSDPGSAITTSAASTTSGSAGSVMVQAGTLTVERGAQVTSSTAGPGKGGDVNITVASDIMLPDPGPQITAQSTGSGDAGSITVSAVRLLMNNGAAISTEAATSTANGGNITLHVRDFLYLVSSEISTSVMGETGNGGNIAIDPQLVILNHSSIIAQAIAGHGGNITIAAGEFIPSSDSIISATSQLGISGTVEILSPRVDVNGALVALSSELRSPAVVLRDSCAAQGGRPRSSLVGAGPIGVPQDLDAMLASLYLGGRDRATGPAAVLGSPTAAGPPRAALDLTMPCE